MTTLELDSFPLGIWKKEFHVCSLGDGAKTVDFLHQSSSKYGLGIPVSPQDLLWGPCGQKYFYYKTEKLFAFLTFFHERTREFSRDNVTRYHKRLSAKHIQKSTYLFLHKTLKRFTKNINQCHSSHFYLKNINFFHFKMYIYSFPVAAITNCQSLVA